MIDIDVLIDKGLASAWMHVDHHLEGKLEIACSLTLIICLMFFMDLRGHACSRIKMQELIIEKTITIMLLLTALSGFILYSSVTDFPSIERLLAMVRDDASMGFSLIFCQIAVLVIRMVIVVRQSAWDGLELLFLNGSTKFLPDSIREIGGINQYRPFSSNETPLIIAIQCAANDDSIEWLLMNGADPTLNNGFALTYAQETGRTRIKGSLEKFIKAKNEQSALDRRIEISSNSADSGLHF